MRKAQRTISEGLLLVAGIMVMGVAPARAQVGTTGAGRSLGGYGAATIGRYYSTGMTSYLPYNGRAGGFIAYSGGYGGGFGVQPISRRLPQTPVGGASMPLTPIGGASLGGGSRPGAGRERFVPFGYEGGIGRRAAGTIGAPLTRQRARRSPSGPGFGYPFQTPSPLPGSPGGMAP